MVNKCCIPRCKGNYNEQNKAHVFKIPEDTELRAKWLLAIPRKNITPSKTTVVCHKHFKPDDVLWENRHFDERTGRYLTAPLGRPRLRADAVPQYFDVWKPLPQRLRDYPAPPLPPPPTSRAHRQTLPVARPKWSQIGKQSDPAGRSLTERIYATTTTLEQLERKKKEEAERNKREREIDTQRKEEQRLWIVEDDKYMEFISSLWPKYVEMPGKRQRTFRQAAIMLLNELLDEQETEDKEVQC